MGYPNPRVLCRCRDECSVVGMALIRWTSRHFLKRIEPSLRCIYRSRDGNAASRSARPLDRPDMANRGVEWDWMNFFWQVWSDGADRLDIADIHDIWPDDGASTSEFNWTNSSGTSITTSASGYLSGDQEDNFFDQASLAGVDHGHNG